VDLASRIFLKFREIYRSQGIRTAATDKAIIAPTGAIHVGPCPHKVVTVVVDNPRQTVIQESCLTSDFKFQWKLRTRLYTRRDLDEQPWSRVREEN
jgi:hypothetical protein